MFLKRYLMQKTGIYDRALLLYGSKRNEVLSLAEIEQYGVDSFANSDYISIYGMPPREWYRPSFWRFEVSEVPELSSAAFPTLLDTLQRYSL